MALPQVKLYRHIKSLRKAKTRDGTLVNVGRTQAGVEDQFQLCPSPRAIWKAIRSKDVSRNVQDYLWKNMHNAYKLGKFWDNIPGFEQ